MKNKSYKILEVEDIGYHNTSDLELEEQHHFYANDIVVSNSHAISYSLLAYWTAYMKAKYPEEFIEVMFNHHHGDHDNQAINLNMAKKLLDEPTVSLGNINTFSKDYRVKDNNITIGIKSVNGVGDSSIKKIEKNRPKGGWTSFKHFYEDNTYKKMVSHKNLQLFVKLGMFDDIPISDTVQFTTRKFLCDLIELLEKLSTLTKKRLKVFFEKVYNTQQPFDYIDILESDKIRAVIDEFSLSVVNEFQDEELINFEIEYLGFRLEEEVELNNKLKEIVSEMGIEHISTIDETMNETPHFWTVIRSIEKLKTKKGTTYANIRVDDGSSFRVWWNKLMYIDDDLIPGKFIVVKLNCDNFGRSLAHGKKSFLNGQEVVNLYDEATR